MSWDTVLTLSLQCGFSGDSLSDLHAIAGMRLLNVHLDFKLSNCVITSVHVEQSGCDVENRGQSGEDE